MNVRKAKCPTLIYSSCRYTNDQIYPTGEKIIHIQPARLRAPIGMAVKYADNLQSLRLHKAVCMVECPRGYFISMLLIEFGAVRHWKAKLHIVFSARHMSCQKSTNFMLAFVMGAACARGINLCKGVRRNNQHPVFYHSIQFTRCVPPSALSRLQIRIDRPQTPQLQEASGENRVRRPIEPMRHRSWGVCGQPCGAGAKRPWALSLVVNVCPHTQSSSLRAHNPLAHRQS